MELLEHGGGGDGGCTACEGLARVMEVLEPVSGEVGSSMVGACDLLGRGLQWSVRVSDGGGD